MRVKLAETAKLLKEEKATSKVEREQFRKWRHRNKGSDLSSDFESASKIASPKMKSDKLDDLLERFRVTVLSKTRETLTTTVRKT